MTDDAVPEHFLGPVCTRCDGEGVVYTARPFPDDPGYEVAAPCPTCGGLGWIAEP